MIAYVENRLPAMPDAVRTARHGLAMALLTELAETDLDAALLLATEAITQAIASTAPRWRLEVDVADDQVRVAVRFRPGDGATSTTGTWQEDIRSSLFAALTTSWGLGLDDRGVATLWFEVPRRAPVHPPS